MAIKEKTMVVSHELHDLCAKVFQRAGVPVDISNVVASSLVTAEMRGLSSHGVRNVKTYLARVREGGIVPDAKPKVEKIAKSIAWLDGQAGFGQLAADEACNKGMEIAKDFGTAFVLIGNTNHAGALGIYTSFAAQKGYICFMCGNANPTVAVPGGKEAVLGTNPLAFSFPSRGDFGPITVDLATSAVAKGKIYELVGKEASIPEGWALDKEGKPTKDVQAAIEGVLLPLGGPKGYSLAVAVEMLAGVLDGRSFTSDIASLHRDAGQPQGVSLAMFLLKIDLLKSEKEYFQDVDRFITRVKGSEKGPGINEIFLPGEREQTLEKESSEKGIAIPVSLYEWLLSNS